MKSLKKVSKKVAITGICTIAILSAGILTPNIVQIKSSPFINTVYAATTRAEHCLTDYGTSLTEGKRIEAYSQSKIKVYLDSSLDTPGSKDGNGNAKYYNACITNNDLVYIFNVKPAYCYISYPVGNSRRYGYIRTTDLLVLNYPKYKVTSKAKVSTYRQSNLSTKAGEVWVGDSVFTTGFSWSDNTYRITYNISAGNWKSAWVSRTDYIKICGDSRYAGVPITSR